jgi:ABC-type transport system involved in multi-copper enzyme maturation permease subunit
MNASIRRIWTIARNTLTEVMRQKVLNVIFVFGLILLGGSNFFAQFTFQEELKFLKDLGYAAVSLTGLLIALLGAAQLIPAELERRTLYTVLSKPVRRFEFIVGKYVGLVLLLTVMIALMSAIFAGLLGWKEATLVARYTPETGELSEYQANMIASIREQTRDPRLLQAVVLIWAKLCLVAVLAVFFSTMASSTIFIVATTLLVYFVGHLQTVAREAWAAESGFLGLKKIFLGLVALTVPDFTTFNVIDEIIAGNPLSWAFTSELLIYSLIYTAVLLLVASLIFEDREL